MAVPSQQQRVLEGYEDWAESHQLDLLRPDSLGEMVDRIESLVGIEVGDLNLRHQGSNLGSSDLDRAGALHGDGGKLLRRRLRL